MHRDDGPAYVDTGGEEKWYQYGVQVDPPPACESCDQRHMHLKDGLCPACVTSSGAPSDTPHTSGV